MSKSVTDHIASKVQDAAHELAQITLLPPGCRTLVVGDGDFAFSAALATTLAAERPPAGLDFLATSYDSAEEVEKKYARGAGHVAQLRKAGACVEFGVDATQLGQCAHARGFERILFNFPQIPGSKDVVSNRMMLSKFLRAAEALLTPDGLVVVANKGVSPYSWWRLEALHDFAGGKLELAAELPWARTEYPSLYAGPCNVDRDQSVKAGDAILFVYAHQGRSHLCGTLLPPATPSAHKFRCEICRVWPQKEADLKSHVSGKMHRKRMEIERRWEAAVASEGAFVAAAAEGAPQAKRLCVERIAGPPSNP